MLVELLKSLYFTIKVNIINWYIPRMSVENKNLILIAIAEREIKNNPMSFKADCEIFIEEIKKTIDKK